jgi:hypothetical protein
MIVVSVTVVVTVSDYCDSSDCCDCFDYYSLLAVVPDVSPVTVRCVDSQDCCENMLVLVNVLQEQIFSISEDVHPELWCGPRR